MSKAVVAFSVNVDQFKKQLDTLSAAVAGQKLGQAADAGAKVIEQNVKLNINKQHLIDTGNLLNNNWTTKIESVKRDEACAVVGTSTEYAAIHEFGGTIKPKKAKLLAIPANLAVRNENKDIRAQNLVFVKTKSGQMFLMDKDGNIRYHLTPIAHIPARPFLRPAIDENKSAIERAVITVLQRNLDSVSGGKQ